MTESSHHEKIELLTLSEVTNVKGFVGNFDVTIRSKPRSVDMAKCTGCGECMTKCPSKTPSETSMGLGQRRAIYKPFSQAVPNVPVIDREHCTYFLRGKCRVCEKVCPAGAIDYGQEETIRTEKFGAIVVATGFSLFDIAPYGEYGAGAYKDVITGLQLERMLDPNGPTEGHVVRPSDGREAKDIVFVQCVGSRDETKGMAYCSKVCCMYTAKQAILLKDHFPETRSTVFYIDIRATGKNYEEFIRRAQREYGVSYIRGRVSRIDDLGDKLLVYGADTLLGEPVRVEADLVVLATAMVANPDAKELGRMLNIPYDGYGFYTEVHPKLQPVESLTKGIFIAGACTFPKDIPDSVMMASAAAAKTCSLFSADELTLEPKLAEVNADTCTGCFNCVAVCPFDAIQKDTHEGKAVARVIQTLCQGCGNCVSACRPGAVDVKGFTDESLYAQITAALAGDEEEEDKYAAG